MKITIDLEDLMNDFLEDAHCGEYGIDESFNLKKELKDAIIRQVSHSKFDKEIEAMREQAKELFKSKIKEQISDIVGKQVLRIINNDKFKFSYSKDEITLSEYIKNAFLEKCNSRDINLDKITKDIANKQAESLKERYDLLFASQFVSKLDTLGLLKPDAAKILLENNDNG